MTNLAMIAGMIPMSLGLGEGGDQTAPLAIAVIGGLIFSTVSTCNILTNDIFLCNWKATLQKPFV